jgi:hypothetical protein
MHSSSQTQPCTAAIEHSHTTPAAAVLAHLVLHLVVVVELEALEVDAQQQSNKQRNTAAQRLCMPIC